MQFDLKPALAFAVPALLLASTVLPAQITGSKWGRKLAPRPDRTIFSPLDLPAPTRLRGASGAPGPDYWQQEASYRIQVSLDPATRRIHGRERVTYVNHSPDELNYIWVYLEQNRLRADSLGALSGGGRAVGGKSEPSDGVKILALSTGSKKLEYHVYDTTMRVEMPKPIPPNGGRFVFDASWEFTVPSKVFRRYGTRVVKKGTIWEIAQWFPSVAVYDDVHGWNTLPYLGTGEFYNNFGTYDVSITAPREHLVFATGVLQNPEQVYTKEQRSRLNRARKSEKTVVIRGAEEVGDKNTRPAGKGPLTWRFHAEKVRTFAWASSDAFIFDAAGLDDKLIQSAYPQEDRRTWSKSTQMLRTAIRGYSKRWFPYAYPVATNVDGVEGGMEYPMIIFCRGRSERGLYGVTTHEIGHNWFPMVVNTNERRHAWMDEGFNTFINIYSTQDWFGKPPSSRTGGIAGMMRFAGSTPIETIPDQLGGMQLGVLAYRKPGIGLQILREHVLGHERFDYAFRTYIRRWAFKSPRPADFFRTMNDAAGSDLSWFWRGWFLEGASLDQAVDSVRPARGRRPTTVMVTNLARMVMPVTCKATFADGSTEERKMPVQAWFRSNRIAVPLQSKKEVRKVQIDPERAMPDINRGNNVWTAKD